LRARARDPSGGDVPIVTSQNASPAIIYLADFLADREFDFGTVQREPYIVKPAPFRR